jgi:hypothetical protein
MYLEGFSALGGIFTCAEAQAAGELTGLFDPNDCEKLRTLAVSAKCCGPVK